MYQYFAGKQNKIEVLEGEVFFRAVLCTHFQGVNTLT